MKSFLLISLPFFISLATAGQNTGDEQKVKQIVATFQDDFNEGYYSECKDTVLRNDLCLEAMRLTYLLIENKHTNLPAVNALLALMCFHSSRFEARKNDNG